MVVLECYYLFLLVITNGLFLYKNKNYPSINLSHIKNGF